MVAAFFQGGIVFSRHAFLHFHRYFVQKIIREDTASVRRADGGQGCDVRRSAAGANGEAAVQSALGVGDDIYLFAAGLLYNLPDALRKLLSAVGDGGGGLLAAVVDRGAVSFQGIGNPAPVIKETEIPEKYAVHEQQGIFRLAETALGAGLVEQVFLFFKRRFICCDGDNPAKRPDVDERNPSADNADDAPLDAKLDGGGVYADDAVPEEDGFHQHEKEQADQSADAVAKPGNACPQEKRVQDNKDESGYGRGEEKL